MADMFKWCRRPIAWLAIAACLCSALAVSLREAHASSPTPQLPNLVADPPEKISLGVSETSPTGQPETKLLLRFDGYVHNTGPGALDIRGSRSAPPDPKDLTLPHMSVFQRIYEYETTAGPPPTGEEVPHKDEPIGAVMEYVEADGHEHWHLQHVAYYSLWNSSKTAEVAPAQKVGFCLDDSEHVESSVGPPSKVYADTVPPYRQFCQQGKPAATSVFEGVSAGWRDLYSASLAFQWVDASDVLPGEYWLREEVNPEHTITEEGTGSKIAYATERTVIPGYNAIAQTRSTEFEQPINLIFASKKSGEPEAAPQYQIEETPKHGTLAQIEGNKTVYTPTAGFSGSDSFTFSAHDPNSSFPLHPAVATVAISVKGAPSVAIEGAPSSMIAGTSVKLAATVNNDAPEVTWSADAGTIARDGLYEAPSSPPSAGTVTITAESAKGAIDKRTITILPVPVAKPAPEAPPPPSPPASFVPPTSSGGSHPVLPGLPVPLSIPSATLIGRKIYMTTTALKSGRLRLSAFLHSRRLGSCVTRISARLPFTCAVTLPQGVSTHAAIDVWATLRVGSHLLQNVHRSALVHTTIESRYSYLAHSGNRYWKFICGM